MITMHWALLVLIMGTAYLGGAGSLVAIVLWWNRARISDGE